MKAPWSGKLSAAKAGWLIALLFFGWLAFLFVPAPKPEPPPAPLIIKPAPSRLIALGLPDNTDLEHLPEYFALYADKAEWKKNKTLFSFWNPGSNSHSYYFEAVRINGSYHFTPLPMIYAAEEDEIYDDGLSWSTDLPKNCPIRLVYTDQGYPYDNYDDLLFILKKSPALKRSSIPAVELKLDHHRIALPPFEQKLSPPDLEQKK
jgi:hypothetical protein